MSREPIEVQLSVKRASEDGKTLEVFLGDSLSGGAFNKSINDHGNIFSFAAIGGEHLSVELLAHGDSITLTSDRRIVDLTVRSITLHCVPYKQTGSKFTEVRVLRFEACGEEPVEKDILTLAEQEVRSSLPSSVWTVYFMQPKGHKRVKIGVSRDPESRKAQLQTGAFSELDVIGTITGTPRLEKTLHSVFAKYRMTGEWFTLNSTVKAFIEKLPNLRNRSRDDNHHSDTSRSVDHHSKEQCLITSMRSLLPRA